MAQAVRNKEGCRVARTISGNSPLIVYIPEGYSANREWVGTELAHGNPGGADTNTSTTYAMAGCFVYMNSTRALECFPSDPVATGFDTDRSHIVGLVLQDFTAGSVGGNAGLRKVAIAAAVPDTIFECALTSTTATTTGTVTASLIGCQMAASTNGSWFSLDRTVQAPATGTAASMPFRVVDVLDADGTQYGRVQFVVNAADCEFG